MKSEKSKVLHEVCGKPMVEHVIDACVQAGINDIVLIAGKNIKELKTYTQSYKKARLSVVLQSKRLGTAHAVQAALKAKKSIKQGVLILSGDVPLLEQATISSIIREFTNKNGNGIIGVSEIRNPYGYGRILQDKKGFVSAIVEEKDTDEKQKKIKIVNGGVYLIKKSVLVKYINRIKMNPKKKEYYLTDIADLMSCNNVPLKAKVIPYEELSGVNDRIQLAEAGKIKNKKLLEKLIQSGVVIQDLDSVFIEGQVSIGKDTVIKPFTVIKGPVKIGKKCMIGPSAHIRPGTVVGDNSKIGNYVEVKNSVIGIGVTVSHLSYIGDAQIGNNTNIGAGTITANYDGKKKHKTKIGINVKVGSNVVLVAPVKIGCNVTVGAGSVITEDVPASSLVIARARQVVMKSKSKKTKKSKRR
jgi:bifunctional UDP-N-acetylglucosamine pyrophosphorylase/glucosamine-1-phosphate N-acetyltransferase